MMASCDVIDVGTVYVNTVNNYTIELSNVSDIDATFSVGNCSVPHLESKFKFSPSSGNGQFFYILVTKYEGVIPKSVQRHLDIEFIPDSLGKFEVTYDVAVKGATYPVKLTFKGEMLGPTFVCDVEQIAYGKVSYSFTYTRSVKISNTSEIPMRYTIKPYVDDK
jgi:hydrocephalus-inducing protein